MLFLALILAPAVHAAEGAASPRAELPASGPSTSATLEGKICFDERDCDAYSVDLNDDGTVVDSLRRRGTYRLTGASLRDLTIDFGQLGGITLGEGEPDCWADPGPGINPAIGQINVCQVALHEVDNFHPTCGVTNIGVLTASPAEDGHWSAARLTPDVPMWVQRLRYSLNTITDPDCGSVGHSYQVFLGAADAPPPASPTLLASGFVPVGDLGDVNAHILVDLPGNTFVDIDESIFVSVEMVWDGSETVCQFFCMETLEPDMGYWSNAVTTPYSWQDLNDFGIGTPMITAYGLRLF